MTIKTRSQAPYALVKIYRSGGIVDAELVGYAYSQNGPVIARARRLGATILPIVGGKVTVAK